MLKVLSWGVGLQSTALLEMSLSGNLPKLDAAIFADTGYENPESYDVFEFYAVRARAVGIRVERIGGQDIFEDNHEDVSVPLFVRGSGRQIRRRCTRDYKIRPIHRKIRELLGVGRRGRLAADLVELWLGITIDEVERAKDSRVAYINHSFPLLNLRYHRRDCATYLENKGLMVPPKSACLFCPYQGPEGWDRLRKNQPVVYQEIAGLEGHINDSGLVKIGGHRKNVSFVPIGDLQEGGISYQQPLFSDVCEGGFCHS